MSDFDQAALGVKTEVAGDIAAKIVDGTITSQALAVAADGSIKAVVSDGGGSITVDASALDIRHLTAATDTVAATDGGGSLTVDATALDIRHLTAATDTVAATDGGGSLTVDATSLDIRHLSSTVDNIAADLRVSGTAVSASNPIPVVISVDSQGAEINDYNLQTVAVGSPLNHDYTVTAGTTLLLTQIECSASARARFDIQIETAVAGTFATKFTKHNSVAEPDCSIVLKSPISVPAGKKVRVIMTNRDSASQDLSSTISGQEV